MTQSATDHTPPNDGIIMYELKSIRKQIIVHSFRVVYQHLFTRKDEFYEKNSVRRNNVLAEICTAYLPNKS